MSGRYYTPLRGGRLSGTLGGVLDEYVLEADECALLDTVLRCVGAGAALATLRRATVINIVVMTISNIMSRPTTADMVYTMLTATHVAPANCWASVRMCV